MLSALAVVSLIACSATPGAAPASAVGATTAAQGTALSGPPPASAPIASATSVPGTFSGSAVETMNSGGYTYARLQAGKDEVWIAASETTITKGERLTVPLEMPMQNFHSKTLNRDFPLVYFVSTVAREGETLSAPSGQASAPALAKSHEPTAEAPAALVEKIPPPSGGMSIADVWAKRTTLKGQPVIVRGRVMKVNNSIMDRNWLHLQDGSGSAKDGTNDLTITTSAEVKVGDTLTLSGILAIDKDFGAGYAYEVLLENATVKGT